MASLVLLECVGCGLRKIRQDARPSKLCCRAISVSGKDKVDALNWPRNLDPVTKTSKTCRYVEAAFLWRVKTAHNTADNCPTHMTRCS
jgi:hypothetical protein